MCELEPGDRQCPTPSYRCVSYVTRLTHTAPKCTGPSARATAERGRVLQPWRSRP